MLYLYRFGGILDSFPQRLFALRIHPNEDVFVADAQGLVRRFNSAGIEVQTYTDPGLTYPTFPFASILTLMVSHFGLLTTFLAKSSSLISQAEQC